MSAPGVCVGRNLESELSLCWRIRAAGKKRKTHLLAVVDALKVVLPEVRALGGLVRLHHAL